MSFKNFVLPSQILLVALVTSIVLRSLALNTPYFCWDEHDYIAHNIYHRMELKAFEIPFSNKWPLGHFLVYSLTAGWDPFQITSYRIATAILDSITVTALTLLACSRLNPHRTFWLVSALFSAGLSVPLRLSAGIIAENLANPFLALAALCLQRSRSLGWGSFGSVVLFSCACWVKPTAVFPGFLMSSLFLWTQRKNTKVMLIFGGTAVFCLLVSIAFVAFNSMGGSGFLLPSAWNYNLSSTHFRVRPAKDYLDLIFTGISFFQFNYPWLIFSFFIAFAIPSLPRLSLPWFWLLGAALSLGLRPAGAQSTYWLYALPPLLWLGWLGWQVFLSKFGRANQNILWGLILVPLAYGWMMNLAGPSLGIVPGSRGGVSYVQTQVKDLEPALHALETHPTYHSKQSRLFLWGMPWQVFYLSRCIPSSSLLTNESWAYGIKPDEQRRLALNGLEKADFVWIDKGPGSGEVEACLNKKFSSFYQCEGRILYARIQPRPR